MWNVEEHRYTKNDKDKSTLESELAQHELIPEEKTALSFWEKFVEVQFKMLLTSQVSFQFRVKDPVGVELDSYPTVKKNWIRPLKKLPRSYLITLTLNFIFRY